MSKTRLAAIQIRGGNTSLAEDLGGYYTDMKPALALVESGYFGPFDEQGVALTSYQLAGRISHVLNLVTTAQYALALNDSIVAKGHDAELARKLHIQLDAIVAAMTPEGPRAGLLLHHWDSPKYDDLRSPWASGLSQGNAISALLRGYQLFGDDRWLKTATSLFEALDLPMSEGGVRDVDECGHLWFEEYPAAVPTHVLNGFIFALWGVLDYARVTGNKKAWVWWNEGLKTLRAHLADFDTGYWSVYDLKYRELTSQYYQTNVHVPQMRVMYSLTSEPIFKKYGDRWEKFSRSLWCRGVWWIGLRVHARMRKIRSLRNGS
ncbi:MAG: D-glucuronyl C5-epimerase family protein [Acidobacteriota bacterium]